ncbi:MAG: MCE family protein [Epsilonproteobacteria bacterium]|nr:MCE family protein [Campylobacterota bacterium]
MEIKEPKIGKKRDVFFSIWMVPVIAFIVAGWFMYQYYSNLGPTIEIEFKNSGNLKEGESKIKFKDVPVGVVEKIKLKEDNGNVLIIARMDKNVKPYLNETTKFWIVKPRIDFNGISGLETIMSGSYIKMYAKLGYEEKRKFKGLDEPYIDTEEQKGSVFHLFAQDSRNLKISAPVYYKKIEVGEIRKIKLDKNGQGVDFEIFVKSPYDKFVKPNTKFWALDIFSVDFRGSSLNVDIAPASDVIRGGVAFETTLVYDKSKSVPKDAVFTLYKSKSEALKKYLGSYEKKKKYFEMVFNENIAKLDIGAPVEFMGFTVGKVIDIKSRYDSKKRNIKSKVLTVINTSSFSDKLNSEEGFKNLKEAVSKGLRAKLSSTILQTGYIDLVFTENNDSSLNREGEFYSFPTVANEGKNIMKDIQEIVLMIKNMKLDKISHEIEDILKQNKKPIASTMINIEKTTKYLEKTAAQIQKLLSSKEIKSMPKSLDQTIKELQTSLKSLNKLLETSNTKLNDELSISLKNMNEAAKILQRVLLKVEKKPNSLIMGD